MKKIDTSTSIWYKRYIPYYIEDLILPQEFKDSLQKDVNSQDLPCFGLFSSNPGCILPGTSICVSKEPNFLTYKEIKKTYNLTKSQINKLRRYTNSVCNVDENLITPKLLEIVKLSGSAAYSFGANYKEDKKYKDKHLKLMHWIYKKETIDEACKEVQRIRKFHDFFDINLKNKRFINFKEKNIFESLLKIKFDIIYSNINKINDLYPFFDKWGTINFWIIRGWTEEEAKEKITKLQIENLNKRIKKYSPEEMTRQRAYGQTIQYFLDKGLTEEDAKLALRERQKTFTLEKCIDKHGEIEGTKIWNDRQLRWQQTLKSKSQVEIDDINRRKSSGYNNFKYPIGTPGKLYYIRFFDSEIEFWKIGITKQELDKRFKFDKIEYSYEIIFEKEFKEILDAFILEQRILSQFNKNRITINNKSFSSTECFNKNVLEKYLNV